MTASPVPTKTLLIVALSLATSACSAPFLRPLHTPETLTKDEGLVGTWSSEGETRVRAVVDEREDAAYRVTLDVWHEGEHKTTLLADLWLVGLGKATFGDLQIERKAREKLGQTYGLLMLPMHQIVMLDRDGDTLRVRALDVDWLETALRSGVVSLTHSFRPSEGGEVIVITAGTDELQRFFRENAGRSEAFAEATVFKRAEPARE